MPASHDTPPEGYRSVTPYLAVDGAARAISFYAEAFGARERMRLDAPGGKVGHAELEIGDSVVMLADRLARRRFRSAQGRNGFGGHTHLRSRRGRCVRAGGRRRCDGAQAGGNQVLRRPQRHPARPVRAPLARIAAGGGGAARRDQAAHGGAVRLGVTVRPFGSRMAPGVSGGYPAQWQDDRASGRHERGAGDPAEERVRPCVTSRFCCGSPLRSSRSWLRPGPSRTVPAWNCVKGCSTG